MPLTDAKLRSLKAKNAAYKVSDSEGLYLLVPVTGAKLWRFAYRFDGKQKSFALGKYPGISLLNARRSRDDAKRLLLDGVDPSVDRKAQRRKRSIAAGNTFEAVTNEWFRINENGWAESYSIRLRSRLDDDLLPSLGKRPIAEIQPLEILDAIRKIEARDAIEMARRVMQMASGIFRYGVATASCGRDPTTDLKGALKPPKAAKHRTALPAKEVPEFVAALPNNFLARMAVQQPDGRRVMAARGRAPLIRSAIASAMGSSTPDCRARLTGAAERNCASPVKEAG